MVIQDTGAFRLRPYRPARWLPGGHLQTIGGWLLRRGSPIRFRRERLDTPDGDFVDLDWVPPSPRERPDTPLALVLHGLEGGASSRSATQALRELTRCGLRGVALNFRSCSGEPNRTARFYHAGDTEDLGFVVRRLRSRFPHATLGVLGYSLGGNVLLKYLGERGEGAADDVAAAAAISVPFDLAAGAAELERGVGRLYARHFLRTLRSKYTGQTERLGERCDLERVARSRTLREFDDAATAPLHGFQGAADYYHRSSSADYLVRIRVPTLVLHALDDPFLPRDAVPLAAIRANPHLVDAVTGRGGHVGFVEGPPWRLGFWAEREAARFLAYRLLERPGGDADRGRGRGSARPLGTTNP
jgi:uncharacterized protein